MNINRVFNTVKYMNCRQLIYRFRYEINKRVGIKNKFKDDFKINYDYKFRNKNFITKDNDVVCKANKILQNEFIFLNNLKYKFDNEIDWNINPFNYRLWNFNLNYFDFLDTLYNAYKITENDKYLDKGIQIIISWIEKNKKYDVNTWDPYVVSKRVFNFINFVVDIKEEYKIDVLDEINSSIYAQSKYLSNNIEYYLDANHVIMDAKGLVFAGVYLNDSDLLEKGISILDKEYERQVLSDGGHYERSPSYQVEVLSHYVECYILLVKNKLNEKSKKLIEFIDKMSIYLSFIIMPNGNIPLLNDSSLDYPFKADDLLQVCSVILDKKLFYINNLSNYALSILDSEGVNTFRKLIKSEKYASIENVALKESGYYIIKDLINNEEVYILFDGGDGGPDYNLGHTHADSLNVILTVGNKELLVDSGTYTYKIGEDRNYYRSTLAHNTIEIDNKNSSDIWGGFRVAKRAKSFVEKYEENEDFVYIRAYHNGYCKTLKKDKIIHTRELVYIKGKSIFIIDKLSGNIKNSHSATLNYNINKEIFDNEKQILFTQKNNFSININREYRFYKSKYSQEFSIEKECTILRSKWDFEKENFIVTSIMINDNNLELEINTNSIEIKQGEIQIVQISR